MKIFLRKIFKHVVFPVASIAIGKGILSFLNSRNIYPQKWVESLLNFIFSSNIELELETTGWFLAGAFGIILYALEVWFKWVEKFPQIIFSDKIDEYPVRNIITQKITCVDFVDSFGNNNDKYKIEFNGIIPEENSASLYLQFSNSGGNNYYSSEESYQYSNSNEFIEGRNGPGFLLISNLRNKFSDEVNGWIELIRPSIKSPRKEFTYRISGIDVEGVLIVSEGAGAFVGSPNPIRGVRFRLNPGNFIAGEISLTAS